MENNSHKRIVHSLVRGLGVLEEVSSANEPIGITDLGRQLGLAKGSVARLVATLVQLNYLTRDPQTRKYQLGVKLLELGSKSITRLDIRNAARPVMEELHKDTGETVHLSVLSSDGRIVFLDKLDSTKGIRPNIQLGAQLPVHCVANGKAILAFLPETKLEALLSKKLRQHTDTTITKKPVLLTALEEVRRAGYALNVGEFRPDVSGVGAAILDHTNYSVAALGVSLPTTRMSATVGAELGQRVALAARKISVAMGSENSSPVPDDDFSKDAPVEAGPPTAG